MRRIGKRVTRLWNYRGRRLKTAECARLAGISRQLFWDRVVINGWSVAEAIETGPFHMKRSCSYCGKEGHYRPKCSVMKTDIAEAQR